MDPDAPSPPPRAFTQGVGTVFQWVGVILFLASMFVCCGSALISRDRATQTDLTRVGWPIGQDSPVYSAQRALSISLVAAVFFGIALAGVGLGLQAQNRRAAPLAVGLTAMAAVFWIFQVIFFATLFAWTLMLICLGLLGLFGVLTPLASTAWREMRADPPPQGHEILPADYRVPYSHLHDDPPDVRLARELKQRRQRLAVQQKELEMLEDKLRRKLQQKGE